MSSSPAPRPSSLRLVFAGTPEFSATALDALLKAGHTIAAVYTQPDRPAGRGRKLHASPVKQLALTHGLPVCQPAQLKSQQAQQELAAWQADLMIVAAYGLLLPQAVLDIPRLGCLNIHASLLPRWRGAAPIQRAILAGDSETGITIMQMDAGLDTGPMLLKLPCPIRPDATGGSLHDELAQLGATAIVQALTDLQSFSPEPQDERLATYAKKLQKDEARLDWQQDAAQLERQVRAFNPWPVCFTRLYDEPLRVWEARVGSSATGAIPGQVLAADKHGIEVACAVGSLLLTRIQPAGGKPMRAADFLNGHPGRIAPGLQLV